MKRINMKRVLVLCLLFLGYDMFAQTNLEKVQAQIEKGNFMNAHEMIENFLEDNNLSNTEKEVLKFEHERMDRISKDFNKTETDILQFLEKYYPGITSKDLEKWEKNKKLEFKYINGKKLYFNRAARNLFLLDEEAKAVKEKVDGISVNSLQLFLSKYIPKVIEKGKSKNNTLVNPVKITLNYTLTVDANAVPEGEVIRCWLPYPKETNRRQKDVKLLSINSNNYVISNDKNLQRSIYLEKVTEKDKPTVFNAEFEYSASAEYNKIEPERIKAYNKETELYKHFTSQVFPHIMFSDKIKELSNEIIGEEKNPFYIAKKIFTWIDKNIPWAGAREYSTIYNIPEYVIDNKHGDCGQVSLLFITLCRYNGIPAKWQSGWMLHPGDVNLHDWAEFYLEGYGWLPVDQSFGITKSEDENVNYFYLGGMDSYRLIVNDDISAPLFPAKLYPRSETVDFQRGEVEWRGGNLYFDKWDYNMNVKYSE